MAPPTPEPDDVTDVVNDDSVSPGPDIEEPEPVEQPLGADIRETNGADGAPVDTEGEQE